jgi:hypothetical protein
VLTGTDGSDDAPLVEKDFTVESGKTIRLELVAPEGN